MEGMNDSDYGLLTSSASELSIAIESCIEQLGLTKCTIQPQIDAAVVAGMIAGDPQAFFRFEPKPLGVATESMAIMAQTAFDAVERRMISTEAYDERDNKNTVVYSIEYNMQSARQDEFGEAWFPTIVITPDQVGFDVTVRILSVMNDFKRSITGEIDNFDRKNLIRAIADPTILKNDGTRVIPVARAQAASKFVRPTIIPVRTILHEGESIVTAPLAFGQTFSLLGISQTDTLLANGAMDLTDTLDTGSVLENIYVRVGGVVGGPTPRIGDVLKFNVTNLPLSNFTNAIQGSYRLMLLNFQTSSMLINKNTKNNDGSALIDLISVVTNDLIVRLAINVTGSINIETAETVLYGNPISVASVQNAAGELLDLTQEPAASLVSLFANGEPIGYDLKAYRTNMNRRQRGQLINTTQYTQRYPVTLRSPITAIHPVNTDGQTDTSDLASLITATRIRTSNASVGALIAQATALGEYVDARDSAGVGPDVIGVGRFYVKPTFFYESVDVLAQINSVKTSERIADIQAVLVNKLRDYAYKMYRDSEYKAAADALAGGLAPTPVVLIGTDPIIARYLCVSGDLRTLGASEFDVRIVHTLDNRVKGKIFISFSVFDETRNTTINPLNFGNMAWSPEITVVLPISRDGQISRELAVQPRFSHVVNLPVMTVLSVVGISDTLDKIPLTIATSIVAPIHTVTP
jgi:hypothetical protein